MSKIQRPTKTEYFFKICEVVSTRSSCLHRHQGAVIARDDRVISVGYNGSAPGQPHCSDLGLCSKENGGPCNAEGLHGENNALISAARVGVSVKGAVMYCIYSPCRACCNMIAAAGISSVYFIQLYPSFPQGVQYLVDLGIRVFQSVSEDRIARITESKE